MTDEKTKGINLENFLHDSIRNSLVGKTIAPTDFDNFSLSQWPRGVVKGKISSVGYAGRGIIILCVNFNEEGRKIDPRYIHYSEFIKYKVLD